MYEFSSVAPRVARVRKTYRDSRPKVCIERFRLVTDFYRNSAALPAMLRRAKNPANLCEKMPVLVNDDELIVGELASFYRGSALYPKYSIGWFFDEVRSGLFFKRTLDPYDMDREDIDYVMAQEAFWAENEISEFYDALVAGWEGHELLRQRIIKEIPHCGNDLDYPDEMAEWLSATITKKVRSCIGARGNRWAAGLYPVATHVALEKVTWATPDGRRTGEPLSDGISPIQCMDTRGPAATLKSALRIDHRHSANGTLLNRTSRTT